MLTALHDVANALVAYAKEQARRQALTDAVTATRRAVALAPRLDTQGLTNFLNVLEAERSLYTTEDALVQSQRTIALDLVALSKALGGGWDGRTSILSVAERSFSLLNRVEMFVKPTP